MNKAISLLLKYILTIINGLWAIPALFVMILIYPIYPIRCCIIFSERIGHFIFESIYIISIQEKKSGIVLCYVSKYYSNQYWYEICKRNLPVYGFVIYLMRWIKLFGLESKLFFKSPVQSRDKNGVIQKSNIRPKFNSHEMEAGYKYLKSKGWKDGKPFICLLVRDNYYLKTVRQEILNYVNVNYHDYRDSDINDFEDAVQWLISQGVWVLRMGKEMKKKIPIKNSMYIDYAFDYKNKSDFLDVWLFAHANATITTLTGIDQLSWIYNKPTLMINMLPLNQAYTWAKVYTSPKKLYHKSNGKELTLSQYINNSYFRSSEYQLQKIEIFDLSKDEILSEVKIFWNSVCNNWEFSEEYILYRDEFFKALRQNKKSKIYHEYYNLDFRISSRLFKK